MTDPAITTKNDTSQGTGVVEGHCETKQDVFDDLLTKFAYIKFKTGTKECCEWVDSWDRRYDKADLYESPESAGIE